MSDSIVSVYSDARTEYTKQLCAFIVPAYFQFFLTLLEKAREQIQGDSKKLLWQFQTLLNDIPEWNMEKVNNEIGQLQTACGCDYLEDLLTAVFIAHTKVLTAIRVSSKQKKVHITVPKVEHFLFKVLCETSKLLWGSSYLFRDDISSIEKQQNYRSIEGLLQEGVIQAIRALVPVKSILRDFVSNDEDSSDSEDDTAHHTNGTSTNESDSRQEASNHHEPEPEPELEHVPEPVHEPVSEPVAESIPEPPVQAPVVESRNEIIQPAEPPVIRLDDHANVTFTGLDAMFDSHNPDGSDVIEGNLEDGIGDDDEDDIPGLEIMEGESEPLGGDDIEDLLQPQGQSSDDFDSAPASEPDDYEVLV
jgi:hypothetical protein